MCIFLIVEDTEEDPPPDKSEYMAPKKHPTGGVIRLG
jgi:hypothetical protein